MYKKGFTLAEVLITLGVIGVVSAITLPILIQNYQKMILRMQFKRTYSIVSQAMEKARADLGYQPVCSYFGPGGPKGDDCPAFKQAVLNNLKIIKTCTNKAYANGCIADIEGLESPLGLQTWGIKNSNYSVILNNGSILMFYFEGEKYPIYLFDTNGLKGPNKWGYDIFGLYIFKDKLTCYVNYTQDGGMKCSDLLTNKISE